jgi:tubulin polyglutamylase TTLL9
MHWADREWVYEVFDNGHLMPWQRLNHFRNGRELCRKDLLIKNTKRAKRTLEKEGK